MTYLLHAAYLGVDVREEVTSFGSVFVVRGGLSPLKSTKLTLSDALYEYDRRIQEIKRLSAVPGLITKLAKEGN
jgi:hypothetical protein